MKITKYGHACLFIEKEGQTLVIDPGCFTQLPSELPNNTVAIIVTEEHADHFDLKNLKLLLQSSPTAQIFTTKVVTESLKQESIEAYAIEGVEEKMVGTFSLNFTETSHAPVHKTSPCQSLAIQVGDTLYYPSDSYKTTANKVKILALPTSGPWYKVTESIDFVNSIQSEQILATHNALNSTAGNMVVENHTKNNLNDKNRQWVNLGDGEYIEV